MSYIIIATENHPDRYIEQLIGPYEDQDEAEEAALFLENGRTNIIPGYNAKRYRYWVREITDPKDFLV